MRWNVVILIAVMLFASSCAAQTHVDDSLSSQYTASDAQSAQATVGSVCAAYATNPELASLEKACIFALGAGRTLPDFVCQESIHRLVKNSDADESVMLRDFGWRDVDVFRIEVRFLHRGDDQHELYSHASINGVSLHMPDNLSKADTITFLAKKAGGMLVLGEFASNLALAFNPQNQAKIEARGQQNQPASLLYDFDIAKQHSTYTWLAYRAMTHPAISGTITLDPAKHDVQQLAFHVASVDSKFPLSQLSVETTYGMVEIQGAGSFLLPKSSISVQCERLSGICYKNMVEFHSCRKFGVDTRLIMQTDGHKEPADKP